MSDTAASKALALLLAILGNVLILVILVLAGAVVLGLVAFFVAPAIMKLV
ncbi:hypothetical protein [Microbacterium sp.]